MIDFMLIENIGDFVSLFPIVSLFLIVVFLATFFISAPLVGVLWVLYTRHSKDLMKTNSGYGNSSSRSITGNSGILIVGETISYCKRSSSFFKDRFQRYGEVFYTNLAYPAVPISLFMEKKKPLKNILTKLLHSVGLIPAKTCICIRLKSLYSWQLFSILQGVLESDGIERKIQTVIQTFLKRVLTFESSLTLIDKIPALCVMITSTVILGLSELDIKLLEALQSYASTVHCEDRYQSENVIREKIKFALNQAKTSIKEWKERLYMVEGGGDDTDFSSSCCFLEIFLERHSIQNVEDDCITVLVQFLVNEFYFPLVEQMTTLMKFILTSTASANFSNSVKLYKDIIKMKKEPCDANQKLVFTTISTLSWVTECSSSLQQREEQKKSDELKAGTEGLNTISKGLINSSKQNIYSEYKLAIRRLVHESRVKTEFRTRPVYFRAAADMNKKDVITLKFPSDIMMDENYDLIERNSIFDVILCSLSHQMIEFDWIGGSEFVDEIKVRNSTVHNKEAFRCYSNGM